MSLALPFESVPFYESLVATGPYQIVSWTSNTAFGLTFDGPQGHIWPDGLFKISTSYMDRVICSTKRSDTISVTANTRLETRARVEKELSFNCPGCKMFAWPFQLRMDDSRLHDETALEEIASQLVWCVWKRVSSCSCAVRTGGNCHPKCHVVIISNLNTISWARML